MRALGKYIVSLFGQCICLCVCVCRFARLPSPKCTSSSRFGIPLLAVSHTFFERCTGGSVFGWPTDVVIIVCCVSHAFD